MPVPLNSCKKQAFNVKVHSIISKICNCYTFIHVEIHNRHVNAYHIYMVTAPFFVLILLHFLRFFSLFRRLLFFHVSQLWVLGRVRGNSSLKRNLLNVPTKTRQTIRGERIHTARHVSNSALVRGRRYLLQAQKIFYNKRYYCINVEIMCSYKYSIKQSVIGNKSIQVQCLCFICCYEFFLR